MLLLAPVLVLPYYILPKRRALSISYLAMQAWGGVFVFPVMGIKYRYVGKENIPKSGTFVAIANHNSLIDTPAIVCGMKRPLRFLGKSELIKIPVFGFIYKHLVIPVDRSSRTSRAESVASMREDLRNDISILIFPEGGINMGSMKQLKEFQLGAFTMGVEEHKPILPVILRGTDHCLNGHGLTLRLGVVVVEFMPVVETSTFSNPAEALAHCQILMQSKIDSYNLPSA